MTEPADGRKDAVSPTTNAPVPNLPRTDLPAPGAPIVPPTSEPPAPAAPPARESVDAGVLAAIGEGRYYAPHGVLGLHEGPDGSGGRERIIRTRRPLASAVDAVLADGERLALEHVGSGVWEGRGPFAPQDYLLEARYDDGSEWTSDDPYRFPPTLGELDLHLIGEGRHEELWRVLGAHVRDVRASAPEAAPVAGASFAVWAPHAQAVRVVGDFNRWDGTGHAMRSLGSSGVWELFVPALGVGSTYKFELLTRAGEWIAKADPMARAAEVPPATASVIAHATHEWSDDDWMRARAEHNPHLGPMSVYELHLGSWRPGKGYREIADELIEYVQWLGYTHVEFLPLAEHPFGGSWGYQVTGYYAPTSRFGSPDDLRYLIDRLHQAGIGVLLDWVPGHFPKDAWALARFDGEALYEHPDPRRGEQLDWGTLVFDFGEPRVRNFLVANATYWLEEFHVDGLRVDAVASMLYLDYSRKAGEWEPNRYGGRENLEAISFLQEANATAYRRSPGVVMIAEESTSWGGVTAPTSGGGLGFGLKWNMGWMHDTLQYIHTDPLYRSHHHGELTFSFVYAFSEHFLLPISHDEVVHGKGSLLAKMPGDHDEQLANARAYLAYMWAHPGKQLLFMGQEFGQLSEWSEARGLDWWMLDQPGHRALAEFVGRLNALYRETPALWALDHDPSGLEVVDGGAAAESVLAFLRFDGDGRPLLFVANFSGLDQVGYRIGLPSAGRWREVLNSDASEFGGRGAGNLGGVDALPEPYRGRPASATITIPARGALWLVPED
ncbi:1,4-alpha-glucan branching protein GlgB [Agromyces seonyuensis]|uniref:1,4-alpha-glucan branching enzyme GlgB n=1 Tax=Agromyces seonyuensis TaxID=2662446 RepID=A0A6I4NWI6_9MICO|nr:1,4-alpha-glucan branching protein GlgB [Agromyces seonyuensis]MWB98640.1 1,4-alpha-glucan branching protein GlgB [Agromyces seonyuensis]